ncbi:extracellular solute-binding protein [Paenibacillus sp. LMG 31461]|uniref:Extracellular solute-binding protein n=1 Tax=Paenibacillus plantarum TaxID=2654975 RepID=A0ABX1X2P5_9BACL|nr:extracellular solute-binding protein [Paenibacillus plantarum]NOU62673.1 extracellular solute-binding protein [Paenibacillus plantarum]
MKTVTVQKTKVMLALMLSTALLAACSEGTKNGDTPTATPASSSTATSATSSSAKPAEAVNISLMAMYTSPNAPAADSDVMKKLMEVTNSKLNINWVPNAAYNDKLTASLAAGDLPTIVVADLNLPAVTNAVDAGVFWDLTPYLKDYPNLKRLDAGVLNNASYKGKNYGIYRSRDKARSTIFIRKDWLDNMGLKAPSTPQELLNTAVAFGTGDPDKNGKNDTTGWVMDNGGSDFKALLTWLGGPNEWAEDGGKLVPAVLTPQYTDALNAMKKLYDEHGVNQDFLLVDSNKKNEIFYGGKAGIYYQVSDSTREKSVQKNDPKAQVIMINQFTGPAGIKTRGESGFNLMMMIPKKNVKTEEQLRQVLGFIDKLGSKEAQMLLSYGIEGVHYTMDGDKVVWKDQDGFTKSTGAGPGIYNLSILTDLMPQLKSDDPQVARATEVRRENEKVAVFNPAAPYKSATYTTLGKTLDQTVNDAQSKFILGELDAAGWKKAVEQWKSSGGTKYIDEINAAYQAVKK